MIAGEKSTLAGSGRVGTAFSVAVDQITESEWNACLDGFADASIYQSWAYGAVSWGKGQLSHLVLTRDGQPVALAQLRVVCLPLVSAGVAYLRWGPVCIPKNGTWDASIHQAVTEALIQEYARRRHLLLRVIPHVFHQDAIGPSVAGIWDGLNLRLDAKVSPYRTLRVDLTQEPDLLRQKLAQKWRNQLNQSERNGLTVVEGTGGELYGRFIELYQDMMSRKQFETTVDVNDFYRIQQRLPDSQKMLILISEKDGQPLTGLIGSVVGDTGIYLLGATSSSGMKSKGSYLLQWHMMQRLRSRGCRWYDLGGINPAWNPGVYHFKRGMGGEEICNLGRFSLSASSASTFCVTAGEYLGRIVARFKGRAKTTGQTPVNEPRPPGKR